MKEFDGHKYYMCGGGGGGGYSSRGVITIPISDKALTYEKDAYDFDKIFEEMAKRFAKVPTIEHKCNNCGGTLELKADQAIFKCPYCRCCYAVGTSRIHERYK